MVEVELIYDRDCPNVERARVNLRDSLERLGLPARWAEWDASAADSPDRVRGYGSPTVLVDGRDVAGVRRDDGAPSCRIYETAGARPRGIPPTDLIARALEEALRHPARTPGGWRWSLPALSAFVVALLPSLSCPACWPAYAGLLSTVGLGFLASGAFLVPLTVAMLALAQGSLAYRAWERRGYGPFLLGLTASAVVVIGKFAEDSAAVTVGGVGLLAAASIWNAWGPRGSASRIVAPCPACARDAGVAGARSMTAERR